MKLILSDKNKRVITGNVEIKFKDSSEKHLICVTARAKGALQLSPSASDDEDLTVEIDHKKFPKLSDPNRMTDSPAAFSGGSIHNLSKSVFFVAKLTGEEHVIKLKADNIPSCATLESLEVHALGPGEKVELKISRSAEDGDRRQWMTFVVDDLPLYSFNISATVYKRYRDSDDLKIVIDGETKSHFKENKERPTDPQLPDWFYRFWYFAGALLMGKRVISGFTTKLSKGLHYVEIYADGTPYVESVSFNFSQPMEPEFQRQIRKYKDDKFGRDYNQLDQYILSSVEHWNNFFLSQEYPPPEPLDPNFVKAVIYRESRLGYYPSSNIVDVMQVWDDRNPPRAAFLGETSANEFVSPEVVKHISYSYPVGKNPPRVESREDSVFWGIRWLYYKAQFLKPDANRKPALPYVRMWRTWEEAAAKYNANPELLRDYMSEVLKVYHEGVDLDGNVLWRS